MRVRVIVMGVVWTACLCGQRRFSWQDYCFKNPGAPVCRGNDYAVKRPKPAKDAAPGNVATNPFPPAHRTVTPSVIVVGGVDWRFADPLADALIGCDLRRLSDSALARSVISELGARQGLTEGDMRTIFDGLQGADHLALSVHDNRVAVLVMGRVTDLALRVSETGLKAVSVSGNAVLIGHPDAVDQAVERIERKGPTAGLARLAEQRQGKGEFWAVGSAALLGPQAMSTGARQFFLTLSFDQRFTSDVELEFSGAPSANTLRMWESTLGGSATLEGNAVHLRISVEADEVEQRFGQIADGPLGKGLGTLVKAARYLPARDSTAPRQAKPVIYGLDGGPREVNLGPTR